MANGLTDGEQAVLTFLGAVLAALSAWSALGFPLDHTGLAIFFAALIAGAILALKEYMGNPPAVVATPAKST